MRSMTGYGRATIEVGGRRLVVEARSVNHRFLEVKVRLPFPDSGLEAQIVQEVRRYVDRGVVSIGLKEEGGGRTPEVRVNLELARHVKAELERLHRELDAGTGLPVEGRVTLEMIAEYPGVMRSSEGYVDAELLWNGLRPGLTAALEALNESRAREGAALCEDLRARAGTIAGFRTEIGRLGADGPPHYRQRLEERLARMLQPGEVDPQRLAQEVAILADRVDVSEELTRLTTHLGELDRLLDEQVPIGRRLDFLVQELNREVNTVGAKSQSAPIAQLVVHAKAELERLREQIQNVE